MGSRFLSTGSSTNLTAVSDGSIDIFGISLRASDLTPGFAVKVDSDRHLYSANLSISDITNMDYV